MRKINLYYIIVLSGLWKWGLFDESNYKVAGGLHGVGASGVNALSQWLAVTINRDGSCQIGGKECTWEKTAYKFSGEEMIGAIVIRYDGKELYISSWNSNCLSDGKNYTVTYQG